MHSWSGYNGATGKKPRKKIGDDLKKGSLFRLRKANRQKAKKKANPPDHQ